MLHQPFPVAVGPRVCAESAVSLSSSRPSCAQGSEPIVSVAIDVKGATGDRSAGRDLRAGDACMTYVSRAMDEHSETN